MAKYDRWNRPMDGSNKYWMVTRPHGTGAYRYETQDEAERNARRLVGENKEPVLVWMCIAEYEIQNPPIERKSINNG